MEHHQDSPEMPVDLRGKRDRTKLRRPPTVHPWLLGPSFVLALYWANVGEVGPAEVILSVALTLGATALLLALAQAALRDIRRAGLSVSVFMALLFSYGHLRRALLPLLHGSAVGTALGTILILMVFGLFLIRRTGRDLSGLTTILNVAAAAMIVVPTIGIVYQETGPPAAAPALAGITLSKPDHPRDIYYIILDRYANASTLRDAYGFDNSPFLDYLETKGFFVASDSHSNYLYTQASLASSLNMEYLDRAALRLTSWDGVYKMFQGHAVGRLLQSAGYTFVHIGSWWDPTRTNRHADININHAYLGRLPEFSVKMLETTAMSPFLAFWKDPNRQHWKEVQLQFDELARRPRPAGPAFVFAHILAAHPVYVFDENGRYLSDRAGRSSREMYLNSIRFLNGRLRDLIEGLLSGPGPAPVIILQSDEGPLPGGGTWRNWPREPRDSDYQEKSGILNAGFFPGADTAVLYPTMSPVNTFRFLFNSYFRAGLELLPDRTYSWKPGLPHDASDVTGRIR